MRWSHLASRLAGSLIVIFGVSLLIFTLARVIPGDPARLALGADASPAQVAALSREMGFDRSLSEQYLRFITGALHLDFGRSLYTDHPVIQDIREGFPATLELVIFAGVIITLYGGLIGIASAHFADRWPDNVARMFALLAIAMPNFVWALLLMLLLSFWMGWLPIAGRLDEALLPPPMVTGLLTIDSLLAGRPDLFWDALRHIALPAIALSLPGLAQVSRITRAHLADSYARPYIEFARAYGLRESSVAFRWALRPALTPTLTVLGMQVVAMLGNAFLIETVFLWPGMARYGVQAIVRKDLNAIIGVVMVVSICFVVVNMLVDAIVALLDPRLRLRRS